MFRSRGVRLGSRERGSVTAEFAILLPVIITLVGLIAVVATGQIMRFQLEEQAWRALRVLQTADFSAAKTQVLRQLPEARVSLEVADSICLVVARDFGPFELRAAACQG